MGLRHGRPCGGGGARTHVLGEAVGEALLRLNGKGGLGWGGALLVCLLHQPRVYVPQQLRLLRGHRLCGLGVRAPGLTSSNLWATTFRQGSFRAPHLKHDLQEGCHAEPSISNVSQVASSFTIV